MTQPSQPLAAPAAEALIRRVPIFADLPPDELAALTATLRLRTYPTGSLLFIEGDTGDRMYIVLAGRVAIVKSLGTPDERLVNVRGQGEFIGEMSLLTGEGRRTASARADQEVHLLEVTGADLDLLLEAVPPLAYRMLKVLSRRLRDAHDHTIRDLHEKNATLARAYEELKAAQDQIIAQEALRRDLRLARSIQQSMLPLSLPRLDGVELAARMLPAREIGGDFFDVFPLAGGRLGIAIGDVSGKGIPAALYMSLACSLLRAEAYHSPTPEATLRLLNRHLLERGAPGMFVTAVYGIFDPAGRTFDYVRAGHEHPMVWDAAGAPLAIDIGRAAPLGLFPDPALESRTLALAPGATVLLFTDGVTEAFAPDDAMFGQEGLDLATAGAAALSVEALCERITRAVAGHQGAAPQADDLTLVALRVL